MKSNPASFQSTLLRSLTAATVLWSAPLALAQGDAIVLPYEIDNATLVLDHFDHTTIADVLAYQNDGRPCGQPRPSLPPVYSFGPSRDDLGSALTLSPPDGAPLGSWTYLKYPGQLLTQTNGTLECWVYLRDYSLFSIHQFNFVGECQGNVGGLDITPEGKLEATMWHTVFNYF